MTTPHRCLFVILASGLALSPAAFAQATATAGKTENPGETVQLSEFTVTEGTDTGYVASESTTGTRSATKIADLPFVVNVVTSEFLHDFDYFTIESNLGYTSSLSSVDTEGNFNLRGFPATFAEWNGFYRLGLLDRANIDRIEIIKGPSAAIYGQTSPSGIINTITKRPSATPYEDLSLTFGSFDTERVEGHVNTPLGSIAGIKLSNLISFDGLDNTYVTPYRSEHQRSLADALQAKPNSHSSLILQVDWDKILNIGGTGDSEQLFNYNSVTKTYYGTLAPINLARFSQGGPNDRQNRELTDFYGAYENRFNDIFTLRVSGYGYDRHNSELYNGLSNEFDPVLGQLVGISAKPTRTILNEDGGAGQADLLAHYYMADHAVENQTLFTLDWSQNWRYRLGTSLPSTVAKLLPTAQDPNNPNYNNVPDYGAWTVVTRNDKVRWDTEGALFRQQTTLMGGRLMLFGTLRHDQVTYNLNFGTQYSATADKTGAFPVATPGQVQHFVDSAWTPAAGTNFKLTKNIALYGNYSQSFQASAQSAKLGDQPLPNTRGNGVDYGIKGNFLDDRLVFTIGGYYVTETGIKVTETDPVTGIAETVAGGSQNSKGIETDVTYRATDSLTVLGGFGWVNARLLNEGTGTGGAPSPLDGRRPPTIPVDNGYAAVKYDFKKFGWPGLSFHAGLRYVGISYPDSTATTAGEYAITLPAYYTVDAGLNYHWTQQLHGSKLTHEIGLSVDNALNADYVNTNSFPEASRGFYIHYKIKH